MEAIMNEKEERRWAALCHLSAALMYVGVPLANILAPLTLWLIKRNESGFVDDQGKEAVNFQLSIMIYGLICVAGLLLSMLVTGGLAAMTEEAAFLGLGLFAALFVLLLIFLVIADLVLLIVAAIQASEGKHHRYPFTLRLLR